MQVSRHKSYVMWLRSKVKPCMLGSKRTIQPTRKLKMQNHKYQNWKSKIYDWKSYYKKEIRNLIFKPLCVQAFIRTGNGTKEMIISAHKEKYSFTKMCNMLKVSRSYYYKLVKLKYAMCSAFDEADQAWVQARV